MSDIVGGLRARLIRESVFEKLRTGLTDLGWFDAGRPHSPIILESRSQNQDETIVINTVALSDENDFESGWEMGSNLTEQTWQMYVDFFAENDALGLSLIRDVRDILRGRFTSIGQDSTFFNVYDYRQATPPILFQCEIQNVDTDRAHGFLKPWLEHWYACNFEVVDAYASEG
jgi:hypothetical protein